MTTADKVAELLGQDKTTFATASGLSLEAVSLAQGGVREYADVSEDEEGERLVVPVLFLGASSEPTHVCYRFADGSAIVITGGAWGVEGTEPFSWRSQ